MLLNILDKYREVTKKVLKGRKSEPRPLIDKVLEAIQNIDSPFFFIVNAPTGYGKTSISFSLSLASVEDASFFDKVIHVLPLRSLVDDIYNRALNIFEGNVGRKMMGASETFFYFFPFNVVTIDTFVYDIIKINTKKFHRIKLAQEFGYDYLTQASILNSLIIFDEAHLFTENDLIKTAFMTIMKFLLESKVPIIIMTATLPEMIIRRYKKMIRSYDYVFRIFAPDNNDPYIKKQKTKEYLISKKEIYGLEDIISFIDVNQRNLIIFNTVKDAYSFYMKLKEKPIMPKEKIILLHGRMTTKTKNAKLNAIRKLQQDRFIVITTQVIEAGVDISSDILITEIAPPHSIIQRMGRVARYGEKKATIIIFKQKNKEHQYPYSDKEIEESWKLLPTNINPKIPMEYQRYIDTFYNNLGKIFMGTYDPGLLECIRDPLYRSKHVLRYLEDKLARGEKFLRELMIPISVNDDVILVSPQQACKLWRKEKLKITSNIPIRTEKDIYFIARKIAIGDSIEVKYIDQYDEEVGLVIED